MDFSVIISVYRKDNPKNVVCALESITVSQSLTPNEIILIVDGPIPKELEKIIKYYERDNPKIFKVIWLSENKGLGNALRIGVDASKNEIILRMDSDDISLVDRFQKQIEYLKQHPECDIVGGQITEFIGDEENIVGSRIVPCRNEEIYDWMKKRCPFNHMSVAMRRSKVIDVGNYIDWHFNEDYFLWIRMAEAGYIFANLPDTLVNVRVGKDMYARRGGWKYFKSEAKLQKYMLTHKIITLPRYIYNITGRFAVQVAMPNKLRGFIFQKLFRK